jgi:hypothetical protein
MVTRLRLGHCGRDGKPPLGIQCHDHGGIFPRPAEGVNQSAAKWIIRRRVGLKRQMDTQAEVLRRHRRARAVLTHPFPTVHHDATPAIGVLDIADTRVSGILMLAKDLDRAWQNANEDDLTHSGTMTGPPDVGYKCYACIKLDLGVCRPLTYLDDSSSQAF